MTLSDLVAGINPFKPGDYIYWGNRESGDTERYLLTSPPPGTPKWMREKMVWVAGLYEWLPEQITGKQPTLNMFCDCRNCRRPVGQHHHGKCLFGPTEWD